jgi:hypothetical protein
VETNSIVRIFVSLQNHRQYVPRLILHVLVMTITSNLFFNLYIRLPQVLKTLLLGAMQFNATKSYIVGG